MPKKNQNTLAFRGQKQKRGQRNAQHRPRHRKASSELPGGLQGKKENLKGHHKAP